MVCFDPKRDCTFYYSLRCCTLFARMFTGSIHSSRFGLNCKRSIVQHLRQTHNCHSLRKHCGRVWGHEQSACTSPACYVSIPACSGLHLHWSNVAIMVSKSSCTCAWLRPVHTSETDGCGGKPAKHRPARLAGTSMRTYW